MMSCILGCFIYFCFVSYSSPSELRSINLPHLYRPIRIGALLQENDNRVHVYFLKAALESAKEDLDPLLEEYGFHIDFFHANSGCSGSKAAGSASDLIHEHKVHAIIGPSCTEGCLPVSSLAADKNLPIVSYSCPGRQLTDKTLYPTLTRVKSFTLHSTKQVSGLIDAIIMEFDWDQVGIIQSLDGNLGEFSEAMLSRLRHDNHTKASPTVVLDFVDDRLEYMQYMKENSRIIFFLCYAKDTAELLAYAYKLGMYNGLHAFITIDFHFDNTWKNESWFETMEPYSGFLNIRIQDTDDATGRENNFKVRLSQKLILLYGNDILTFGYHDDATYIYDAMKAYTTILLKLFQQSYERNLTQHLNETKIDQFLKLNNLTLTNMEEIRSNWSDYVNHTWSWPQNWTLSNESLPVVDYVFLKHSINAEEILQDGSHITKQLSNYSFNGQSGEVHIDNHGDRMPLLIVENVLRDQENQVKFSYDTYRSIITRKQIGDIVWPGGSKVTPRSRPKCGFTNEECQGEENINISLVVFGVLSPFLLLIVGFLAWRIYRQNRYEADLLNDEIIFKFGDLEIPELIARAKENKISEKNARKKRRNEALNKQDDDEVFCDEKNLISLKEQQQLPPFKKKRGEQKAESLLLDNIGVINSVSGNQYFCAKLRYDNVFVKKIPKTQVIVNRDIRVEFKEMRDLRHTNLNPYTGFCTGPPFVLLSSPVCQKGSLIDILTNEDFHLNWVFRMQFAMDIASGLQAIHDSPIKVHGHLTSSNILIDSRWNCKISDYGLTEFKKLENFKRPKLTEEEEELKFYSMLWTAPENINFVKIETSREGDIYSYGIILSELINRVPPFTTYTQYKARDYIHFVHKRCIPPFRPHVRLQAGLDGRVLDLMRQCWDEFPENRPTIHFVKTTLKSIQKDGSTNVNLLDNMIEMMEKYAVGLEGRIREISSEKKEETQKLQKVLYRCLPPTIADQLRVGKTLPPYTEKEASMLMFQVDDFSSFIDSLTPAQAVDLLHDVYDVMEDALIPDIQKINCYGDFHVLVCGMPDKTTRHAYLIARCALKIMGSLTNHRFRHIQDSLMRFKIVIHTGPFLAAVVGKEIPVFTSLGRTADYARSALAATPTLRILVTENCKKKLPEQKGFKFEESGPIMIKGHGLKNLHFLLGLKGLPVKLRPAILTNQRKPKISVS